MSEQCKHNGPTPLTSCTNELTSLPRRTIARLHNRHATHRPQAVRGGHQRRVNLLLSAKLITDHRPTVPSIIAFSDLILDRSTDWPQSFASKDMSRGARLTSERQLVGNVPAMCPRRIAGDGWRRPERAAEFRSGAETGGEVVDQKASASTCPPRLILADIGVRLHW